MRPTICAPQIGEIIASSASPISLSFGASSLDERPSGRGDCRSTITHSSQGRSSTGTSARIPRSTKMEATASSTFAKKNSHSSDIPLPLYLRASVRRLEPAVRPGGDLRIEQAAVLTFLHPVILVGEHDQPARHSHALQGTPVFQRVVEWHAEIVFA